jgi:hypothetical protein
MPVLSGPPQGMGYQRHWAALGLDPAWWPTQVGDVIVSYMQDLWIRRSGSDERGHHYGGLRRR